MGAFEFFRVAYQRLLVIIRRASGAMAIEPIASVRTDAITGGLLADYRRASDGSLAMESSAVGGIKIPASNSAMTWKRFLKQ